MLTSLDRCRNSIASRWRAAYTVASWKSPLIAEKELSMSKSHDAKVRDRKKPLLTLKEKRQAKHAKKLAKASASLTMS